jgi:hypothetical protein
MALASPVVAAETLNFDDLSNGPIPNGYGGFDWTNFGVIGQLGSSGYTNGIVSAQNTAFDDSAPDPASLDDTAAPFTFNGADFTAAWRDNLSLEIVGADSHGTVIYTDNVTLNESGPTDITLNWTGLTALVFTPSGGSQAPGAQSDGVQFVMDDATFNAPFASAAPEPETWALMLLGVGAVGAAMRRRQSSPLARELVVGILDVKVG